MTALMEPYNNEGGDLLGQSWDRLFAGLSEDGSTTLPSRQDGTRLPSDAKRLPLKDMPLFGRCPESDPFVTVICSVCDSVIMLHAFSRHVRQRHNNGDDSTPIKSILNVAAHKEKTAKKVSPSKKLSKSASSSPPETPAEDHSVVSRSDADFSSNSSGTISTNNSFRRQVPKHPEDSSKTTLASVLKVKPAKKPSSSKKSSKSANPSPPELIEELSKDNKKNSSKNKKCKSPIPPELEPMLPTSKRIVLSGSGPPELMPIETPKKGSKKKVERKADKVYDPNKHCGVINDTGKPCLRSILCKVHPVALKRAVQNRIMPYDALTKLLKSQNDEEKRPKVEVVQPAVVAPIIKEPQPVCVVTVPPSNDVWSEPVVKLEEPPTKRLKTEEDEDQYVLPSDLDALIEATLKDVEENEPLPVIPVVPRPEPLVRWSLEAPQLPPTSCSPPPIIQPDEIPWHSSHPRPLATNTFGCRLVGGLLSKCKKLDAFRKHVQAVWTSPGRGGPNDSSTKLLGFNASKGNSLIVGKKNQVAASSPRRKRKNSGGSTSSPAPSSATDIISGLLQRASQPTSNGVPLRLFQGNLPVQQPTYIQFNLCPSK